MAECIWFIGKAFYNVLLLTALVNSYAMATTYGLPTACIVILIASILTLEWRCYYSGMVLFLTAAHFTYSVGRFLATSHRGGSKYAHGDADLEWLEVENCK